MIKTYIRSVSIEAVQYTTNNIVEVTNFMDVGSYEVEDRKIICPNGLEISPTDFVSRELVGGSFGYRYIVTPEKIFLKTHKERKEA